MNSALPTCLLDYREPLENAIRRDLDRDRAHRRRRGLVVRSALAAAVAGAAALGALSIVSRHAGGASVVDRAAAAIARSPGTILHVDMLGSQTNPDGSTISWRDESWQQESPPYDRRQIENAPDGTVAESASGGARDELYDPARNTIYVSAHTSPTRPYDIKPEIEPGPRPGTALLRLPGVGVDAKRFHVVRTAVISTEQAKALRKGTGVLAWRIARRHGVMTATMTVVPASSVPEPPPAPASADPTSAGFRGQILALLRSGEARVLGHRTIDGQDTIEIGSADGHTTYYVDPGTYKPVELETRGTGGGTTLRFRTYETLEPGTNRSLLSLAAQHPGAQVDRDPADYQAAEARLFPKG